MGFKLAVGALAVGHLMAAAGVAAGPRSLDGTFIQLLNAHEQWSAADWDAQFRNFERLRLSQLVVQWSVYDETAFYASSAYKPLAQPPLERILRLADEAGIKVRVGLAHDSGFWSKIGRDPELVEVYLRRLRLRSEVAARELAPLVRSHPCFDGWYLTEEIDDVNWLEPRRRALLTEHLELLGSLLHELTPGATVAVSGFSNAHCDPRTLEGFWRRILERAGVDVLLFQDGIGVKKLELDYLGLYLAAVARAVEMEGKQLGVIVEMFRQVDGPPLNEEAFRAVPATLDRIQRQIDIAAAHSRAGVIAFTVPDYMSPRAGEDASQLFQKYLEARANAGADR